MNKLWAKIVNDPEALSRFKVEGGYSACIYKEPFEGKADVVRWFYSRNTGTQVFYACSQSVSDKIDEDSWADVNYKFTVFVEQELMDFCVENTEWERCCKYGIDYNNDVPESAKSESERDHPSYNKGCHGTTCHCCPFGTGDFTNGIAQESEFLKVTKK